MTLTERRVEAPFGAKVALIHTTKDSIVRALSNTRVQQVGSETFIEGEIIAPDPKHFDNGKRVLINSRHIITFTAFTSPEEVFTASKPGTTARVLRETNGHNH